MRSIFLTLLVACGTGAAESETQDRSIQPVVDGMPDPLPDPLISARPYQMTKPSGYDDAVATPLVLLLHGYMGSGKGADDYLRMSAVAQKKRFLLAYPDGTKDSAGHRFWNASAASCNVDDNPDDVAYLRAVIADMKRRFNVDPKRVYVVGHSNGAFMTYRLACELSAEIAAVVSLAGASLSCTPTNAVAALEVHGDADDFIRYGGGQLFCAPVAYPSAKATVSEWAANNGCDATLLPTTEAHDLESSSRGAETVVARHACTRGAAELWTIKRGSHMPPLLPNAAEKFYAFLESHPKRSD
jgi:polyhydroxybutyrate depolymerase